MPGRRGDDAGREKREFRISASEQRQVADLSRIDDVADVGGLRLQQLGRAVTVTSSVSAPTLNCRSTCARVCTLTAMSRRIARLKPCSSAVTAYTPTRKSGEDELTPIVRDGRRCHAGGVLGGDHGDTGQHRAAVVGDAANDDAGIDLRESCCSERQEGENGEKRGQ